MTSTTASIELNLDYQSAHRFPAWMALAVFSAVCLAAVNSQQTAGNRSAGDKWVLSVTIISMCVSFLAVVAYLMVRHLFVAQIPEYIVTILVLAFWGAGLPVLMNPERGIAVEGDDIINANLYLFSWGALATVVYIAGSLLEEVTGVSVRQVAGNNRKAGRWYGLTATSMIVMVSSVRIFVAKECSADTWSSTEYCKRTKFGISLGVLSFVLAFFVAYYSARGVMSRMIELGVTTVLLTMWCFGVGFITFGRSPGAKIGNLYLSTWASFILIVFLFAETFRSVMSGPAPEPDDNKDEEHFADAGEQEMPHHSAPEVPGEDDI